MKVPLFDARRQVAALKPELMAAIEAVVDSGTYILGPEVEAFERESAAYLGVAHAIGVASGTDALWLALKALGIGPGDYVLTSPFTFFATASAILNTGAEPVFADVDPRTFNLDPGQVRLVLEDRSTLLRRQGIRAKAIKALLPVHLYGQPADMPALLELARTHDLAVVEDAAQALGAAHDHHRTGTGRTLGCFSFFPTKNLGAFGDAGLVAAGDAALADRVRLLRAHGARPKYHHHVIGANSRLDALQAGILRVKLRHLDAWLAARQAHAAAYDRGLEGVPGITIPYRAPDRTHTFHQYTIRVADGRRESLERALDARGVGTAVYYPVPLHLQPALASRGYRRGDLPQAELACSEVLSLPIFPELTPEERDYVVEQIRAAVEEWA